MILAGQTESPRRSRGFFVTLTRLANSSAFTVWSADMRDNGSRRFVVYCLECRHETWTNYLTLAHDTETAPCPMCKGILTKWIELTQEGAS